MEKRLGGVDGERRSGGFYREEREAERGRWNAEVFLKTGKIFLTPTVL